LRERTLTVSELFRGTPCVSVRFYAFWCIPGAKVSFLGSVNRMLAISRGGGSGRPEALYQVRVRFFRTGCFAFGGPQTLPALVDW
jgi:hypothetical protein